MRTVTIVSALLLAFLSSPVLAQSFRTEEYKAASGEGVDYVFQLEHDKAIEPVKDLICLLPEIGHKVILYTTRMPN